MKIVKVKNKDEIKKRTIRGKYHEIKDWSMDPKGYFLIKTDRRKKLIVAAHCKKIGLIDLVIEGKTPQEVYFEIYKKGLVTRIDHAAYLGKELQKAYTAIKFKMVYVQDEDLEC
mgnify:CR=1 FL=1